MHLLTMDLWFDEYIYDNNESEKLLLLDMYYSCGDLMANSEIVTYVFVFLIMS